jgi:CRISPR-associated protein Csb2
MVGLAIGFDLGRYHATAWGAHVNEATIEWPPSPWRLLRALYATGRTDTRLAAIRSDLDRALTALARARPPSFELPASADGHTRHYIPLTRYGPSKHDQTSLVIDAFLAIDPAHELRAWWDTELDEPARQALEATAASVGYLGRSESVCTMRLLREPAGPQRDAVPAATLADDPAWANAERVELLAIADDAPDPLGVLSTSVTELRAKRMLVPAGTHRVTYAVWPRPDAPPAKAVASAPRPTIAHLRVAGGGRPALTDAVAVAHLLRGALQRRFDAGCDGARSPVFSGHDEHGPRRDQHAHAHYLALPGRDGRRIDHLFVWAPEGLGRDEVAAIAALRELRMRDAPEPVRVALVALGDTGALSLPRLVGPHHAWHSLTPMALTRHAKRRGGEIVDGATDQVVRELRLRGFPAPADIELVRGAWTRFQTTRPGVARRRAPTVVGVRVRFDAPVAGPIALGGLSHFGLGLLVPERR